MRSRVTAVAMFEGSANVYDRFIGRYGPALADAMLETAGVAPGQRVLDVGCGTGALAAQAAGVVGALNVAAVDPSESFAEGCRARVPGADVRVAAAESLPFADGAFDAVLAQLVVPFMSDATRGAAEMARVAKPGGVVAACVWDYAGEMQLLRAFWDAAGAVDQESAAKDEGRLMRYANPDELGALWSEAGLDEVAVSALDVEASYDDFDDLWTPFLAGIGPAGAYTVSLAPDAQARLREELQARLGDPAGPFTLTARAWCARGAKGAA
jgi:SAM-dependent methyltransferase